MRLLPRPQTITLLKWAQNSFFMSFFVDSPLIPWYHLQENNSQMLWLVQDIQMLWYDWCEIHTLMQQSDWCKIHTLMQQSDWCELHMQMWRSNQCKQHTTLHANRVIFFVKKGNSKINLYLSYSSLKVSIVGDSKLQLCYLTLSLEESRCTVYW